MSKPIRYMSALIVAAFTLFVAFAGTALAAGAVAPADGSWLDLAKPIFDAVMSGQYAFAAAAALVLLVAVARKYGPPWFRTDAGGAVLTLGGSFGGALMTGLVAAGTAGVSWSLLWAAGGVAIIAAGGYSLIKKLVVDPILRPLAAKAPAWTQPIFAVIFWVFDRQSPVEKAIEDGAKAVKKKPAQGVIIIVGKSVDVP